MPTTAKKCQIEAYLHSEGLLFVLAMFTLYRDSRTGDVGGMGCAHLQILADQLTLFQLVAKDYAAHLTTRLPSDFQTFRHPWYAHKKENPHKIPYLH